MHATHLVLFAICVASMASSGLGGLSAAPVLPSPPVETQGPASLHGVTAQASSSPGTNISVAPTTFEWVDWNRTQPPVRQWEALTYDVADGYELMFGGYNNVGDEGDLATGNSHITPDWPQGTWFNDTWIYRNQSWTELCSGTSAAPRCAVNPSPGAASAVYDTALRGVLLVDDYEHTYLFRGGSWHLLNASNTPWVCEWYGACGQQGAPMAYDPITGAVVLVDPYGDTWEFQAGNWTEQLPARAPNDGYAAGAAMYFDPTLEDLVYVYGDGSSAFRYDNASWPELVTSGRPPGAISAEAYDPAFGGVVGVALNASGERAGVPSTWALRNWHWENVSSTDGSAPPYQGANWDSYGETIAWDGTDGDLVVLDDSEATNYQYGAGYNATWTVFPPLAASVLVTPRTIDLGQQISLAWNITGGLGSVDVSTLNLPGGCRPPVAGKTETCTPTAVGRIAFTVSATNPLIGTRVSASAPLTVWPELTASGGSDRTWTFAGLPIQFSITAAGGDPPYVGSWAWGDGTITPGLVVDHEFAPAGRFTATYTVIDAMGEQRTGTVSVYVDTALSATASASATTTDVGLPVQFVASAAGGTGVYAAQWSFPASGTVNGLTAGYAFPEPGSQSVGWTVSDSAGNSVGGATIVQVNPDPELSLSIPSPSVPTGLPVSFSLNLVGGTGPYAVTWSFGDGGDGSSSGGTATAEFSHVYDQPGSFTVDASVTDAVGGRSQAIVNLDVFTPTPSNQAAAGTPAGTAPHGGVMPMETAWLVILVVVAIALGGVGAAGYHTRRRSQRRARRR